MSTTIVFVESLVRLPEITNHIPSSLGTDCHSRNQIAFEMLCAVVHAMTFVTILRIEISSVLFWPTKFEERKVRSFLYKNNDYIGLIPLLSIED